MSSLSSQECELLQLLAEGKNTKVIVFVLEEIVKTIETFRKKLMKKLNLNSVAELTKFAVRNGLTSIDYLPFHLSSPFIPVCQNRNLEHLFEEKPYKVHLTKMR